MSLRAENLHFAYPGGPEFRGLSLDLAPGRLCALIGPNGAGKSAFLRALAGVLPLRGGSVTLGREDLSALSPRARAKRLAYMPQDPPASPLTVYETVLLGRTPYLRFAPARQDRLAAEAALERLGIAAWRSRPLDELSGGERRQVFLALALAQDTPVLLLDEPADSLDQRRRLEVYELLRDICRRENRMVLTAEHDLNLAARYGDEALALCRGREAARGRPEAVFTPELLRGLYGMESLVRNIRVRSPGGQSEERPQILHVGLTGESRPG